MPLTRTGLPFRLLSCHTCNVYMKLIKFIYHFISIWFLYVSSVKNKSALRLYHSSLITVTEQSKHLSSIRVLVSPRRVHGEQLGVSANFSRGVSRFLLPQMLFDRILHFYLIHFIHFILLPHPCADAARLAYNHPNLALTFSNISS